MSEIIKSLGMGLGAIFLLAAAWLYNDYNAWLSFGTGGTPPDIQGYIKITKFRILRALSSDSLTDPSSLKSTGDSYLLHELPKRNGQPPKIVARTLPQRQYPAVLDQASYQRLHDLPKKYAESLPSLLDLDKIDHGREDD